MGLCVLPYDGGGAGDSVERSRMEGNEEVMGQEKEMSRGFCQLNGWRLKAVLKTVLKDAEWRVMNGNEG